MTKKKNKKKTTRRRRPAKRNGPVTSGALKLVGLAALGGAAYYGYRAWDGRLVPPQGATVEIRNEIVLGPEAEDQKIPYLIWKYPQEKGGYYGWTYQTTEDSKLGVPNTFSSKEAFMTAEEAELALMESFA